MKTVADLLDAIRERQQIDTDSGLARALGVSQQEDGYRRPDRQ